VQHSRREHHSEAKPKLVPHRRAKRFRWTRPQADHDMLPSELTATPGADSTLVASEAELDPLEVKSALRPVESAHPGDHTDLRQRPSGTARAGRAQGRHRDPHRARRRSYLAPRPSPTNYCGNPRSTYGYDRDSSRTRSSLQGTLDALQKLTGAERSASCRRCRSSSSHETGAGGWTRGALRGREAAPPRRGASASPTTRRHRVIRALQGPMGSPIAL